jgi:hypothetical protein
MNKFIVSSIVDRFIPVIRAVLFGGLSPQKALAPVVEPPAGASSEARFSLN